MCYPTLGKNLKVEIKLSTSMYLKYNIKTLKISLKTPLQKLIYIFKSTLNS
jgi:hypothetical protein